MSYGGQPAVERLRQAVQVRRCPMCDGQGWTVEAVFSYQAAHACGGDERRCQQVCPVQEPVESQEQVACAFCLGRGWL